MFKLMHLFGFLFLFFVCFVNVYPTIGCLQHLGRQLGQICVCRCVTSLSFRKCGLVKPDGTSSPHSDQLWPCDISESCSRAHAVTSIKHHLSFLILISSYGHRFSESFMIFIDTELYIVKSINSSQMCQSWYYQLLINLFTCVPNRCLMGS